ncbi:hypothetical protein SBA1_70003 [Candidatus Sulfotelmatobacter kueseliae]|uniref:Uncharacterized protein n=1 Tax=Candidatus Sulfotelmatobacter kueseliae TaxID=2042962 RepID=A0A2U3L501_9BACT|nr:hypothetical protein SBA1_70003 [Candidatus Sulfotelmatobacter kueseliae]
MQTARSTVLNGIVILSEAKDLLSSIASNMD